MFPATAIMPSRLSAMDVDLFLVGCTLDNEEFEVKGVISLSDRILLKLK